MELNISRTAAAAVRGSRAPSGAAPVTAGLVVWLKAGLSAGEIAQFFDGLHYGAVGHFAHNFRRSDAGGQHEVNYAVGSFFVGFQAAENALAPRFHSGQRGQRQNRGDDAAGGIGIGLLHGGGDHGRSYHAPGHGFAVQEVLVPGFSLERVADGVAEVEHAAQVAFLFVHGDNAGLALYALRDQPLQRRDVALQDGIPALLQTGENFRTADYAALQ